jgi:hypothetical protein
MAKFVTVSVYSVVYYDRLCNKTFVARMNEHVQQEIQIERRMFHKGLDFTLQRAVSCTLVQVLANVGESPVLIYTKYKNISQNATVYDVKYKILLQGYMFRLL